MKRNLMKSLIACIVLSLSQILAGRIIYVDQKHPQADDRNPGTEALALRTIDRAMALVRPGDRVCIKGSPSKDTPEAIYDRSGKDGLPIKTPGTSDNKIIIEAYPGHAVILQGNGSGIGLALDHASYHEIRGLTFRNFNKAAEGWAAKTDILIERCEFTHTHETGLRLRNVTNLTMRDVYVHHCFEAGVWVNTGRNVFLQRVESSYNSDERGTDGDGDGFDTYGTENFVCVDCVARGNSEDGFDMNCNGALINCISQNHPACNIKAWRREGDHWAPKRLDLVNCIVSGAAEAGIKVSRGAEVHLYNCIVRRNKEEGLTFRNPNAGVTPPLVSESVHSDVINSILVENGQYGIRVDGTSVNVVDADHNLYYQNGKGNLGLHSDTNAITGKDPLFFGPASGMFQLRAESPAIDSGRALKEVETYFSTYLKDDHARDLAGTPRPSGNAWDIGAYERVAVAGNHPPKFTAFSSEVLNANEAETLSFQFAASDPDGHACVFFLAGGNVAEGMHIDSRTGLFSWTPTYDQGGNTASPQKSYDVPVGVTDEFFAEPAGQAAIRIVVHNVNRAPSYDGLGLYTLVEGRPWMFGVPASDADGDAVSYSLRGTPPGMTFDASTGQTSWTATAQDLGKHEVELKLSDGAAETRHTIAFEVLPQVPYQAPASEGNIFYVDDANGSDSSSGQTERTAWKTLGKAAAVLRPGQMVLIRNGVYYESVKSGSGAPGQPIVYKAYPGGKAVLDGSRSGSSPKAIRAGSHLVYDGLTFRNYETVFDLRASKEDIAIVNCAVENSRNYGIYGFAGDRLRIENSQLRQIGDRGIYGTGTNVHLYNVLIDTAADRCISMNAGSVDNVTIMSSEMCHAGRYGVLLSGKNAFLFNTRIHDDAQVGAELCARRNFLVASSVWNTSLFGGTAFNLDFGATSDSFVLNSVLTQSARYGLHVGPSSHVYMRNSAVVNNRQQDILVRSGGALDQEDTAPSPGHSAPEFAAIGDQSVTERDLLSFSISAIGPDGDTLTYSAVNPPPSAAFDPATHTFTWTPGNNQSGVYQIGFQVRDGKATVSKAVKITVSEAPNKAPVLAAIGDKSIKESDSLSFSISATDPDGDPIIYSAQGLPTGAQFSNGTFSWTPAVGQAGAYRITFIASDGSLSDSKSVAITVTGGG